MSLVYIIDVFVIMGVVLEKMGCDLIGIKDMFGVFVLCIVFDFVSQLKCCIGFLVVVYMYDIVGLVVVIYFVAIDVGVDIVEIFIVFFVNGIVQFDMVCMIVLFEGNLCWLKYDIDMFFKLCMYFVEVYKELFKFILIDNECVDSDMFCY